jgi:hypothetical protein
MMSRIMYQAQMWARNKEGYILSKLSLLAVSDRQLLHCLVWRLRSQSNWVTVSKEESVAYFMAERESKICMKLLTALPYL